MSNINKEIAERLQASREMQGFTREALAEQIGLTTEQLTDYESGDNDIPVSLLHNAAPLLGVSTTELMTGEAAKLSHYALCRSGRGVSVHRRAAYDYRSLAFNFSGRVMEPMYITIAPSDADAPYSLTAHGGQEFHYCLEGRCAVQIGVHELILNPGDSVYFDSSEPHGLKALDGKPAISLVTITI